VTRYTDAALLKGEYAHLAAQLKAGERHAPSSIDWGDASCDNAAEEAAQEVAKHIFSFQQELDPESEQMEIIAFSAAGQMRVMAVVPGDGDLIRLDGMLMPDGPQVSSVIHTSQLSLTFLRKPLDEVGEDEDALTIGYVIFDELKERQKARYATKKSNSRTAAKPSNKTKAKTAKSKPKAEK